MKTIGLYLYLTILVLGGVHAQVSLDSSHLPIFVINTNNQEIVNEPRITARLGIINNMGQMNCPEDDFNEYNGQIAIEIRGTSSQSFFPKKQYRFETQNKKGGNLNVSLLGLPEENDWILYAPYTDKSLIRNALTYDLARDMGHYAPRMKFCELVLNDEFMGLYFLVENIKRDRNRVNIKELDDSDIIGVDLTGGYLLQITNEGRVSKNQKFFKTQIEEVCILVEYPNEDELCPQHERYISDYVNQFEETLYATDYTLNGKKYTEYIDIISFVDFMLLNELGKNVDAYYLSTFMYKDRDDRDGKLTMGPVWDFNLAFGNANYGAAYDRKGLLAERAPWWSRMTRDEEFCLFLTERWLELRSSVLSYKNIEEKIDSLVSLTGAARNRNFQKWDVIGRYIWPNYFIGNNYEEEVLYLKEWFEDRLKSMDADIQLLNPGYVNIHANKIRMGPVPYDRELKIKMELKQRSSVTIEVYNAQGKYIRSVIDERLMPGGVNELSYYPSGLDETALGSLHFLVVFINGEYHQSFKILRQNRN